MSSNSRSKLISLFAKRMDIQRKKQVAVGLQNAHRQQRPTTAFTIRDYLNQPKRNVGEEERVLRENLPSMDVFRQWFPRDLGPASYVAIDEKSIVVLGDLVGLGYDVRVFDRNTLSLVLQFDAHSSYYAPSGLGISENTIVTGNGECLNVWERSSGRLLETSKADCDFFVMDGDIIVSMSDEEDYAQVWLKEKNKFKVRNKLEHKLLVSVAIEGDTVVTGSEDSTIRVWVRQRRYNFQVTNTFEAGYAVLSVSVHGNLVVSQGQNTVDVWDRATNERTKTFQHPGANGMAFDGESTIVTASPDGVKVWDVASNRCVNTFDVLQCDVVAVHGDTIVHGNSSQCFVWKKDVKQHFYNTPTSNVNNTVQKLFHDTFYIGRDRPSITLWNGDSRSDMVPFPKDWMTSAIASNDNTLVCGSNGGKIAVVRMDAINMQHVKYNNKYNGAEYIYAVAINEKGNIVVSAKHVVENDKHIISVWDKDLEDESISFDEHTDLIQSIAIHGHTIASGSHDNTVKMWDLREQECEKTLNHGGRVTSVAIDSSVVVSGSTNKTVKLWDRATGECKITWTHAGGVTSVAIDADSVFSSSMDKTVKVWGRATGACMATLEHGSSVLHLALRGSTLASTSEKKLNVWKNENGQWKLVDAMYVDGGNSFVAFGDSSLERARCLEDIRLEKRSVPSKVPSILDRIFRRRNIDFPTYRDFFQRQLESMNEFTKTILNPLENYFDSLISIEAESKSAEHPIVLFRTIPQSDGTTKNVYGRTSLYELQKLRSDPTRVFFGCKEADTMRDIDRTNPMVTLGGCQHFSWGGVYVSLDGMRMKPTKPTTTFSGHDSSVSAVVVDGDQIISVSYDGIIIVWNKETGEEIETVEARVNSIAVDGDQIIIGLREGTIKVWDRKTGDWIKTLHGHTDYVTSVAVDGDHIISGSDDNTIKVWDRNTGDCLKTLEGHRDCGVTSIAVDGDQIVSAADDNTIKVWDRKTGECLKTLEGHKDSVTSVAIDEDKIVSGSDDKSIKVWDRKTGDCLKTLEGHTYEVNSVAIDEDYIVSGSDDGTVKIWNKEGKCIKTLFTFESGQNDSTSIVSVAIDGDRVISSERDNVHIWDLDFEDEDINAFDLEEAVKSNNIPKVLEVRQAGQYAAYASEAVADHGYSYVGRLHCQAGYNLPYFYLAPYKMVQDVFVEE